jgi:hypothetical protein
MYLISSCPRLLTWLLVLPLAFAGVAATPTVVLADTTEVSGAEFGSALGSQTIRVAKPSSAAEGDLLLAVISVTGRNLEGPEGWELLQTDRRANDLTQSVWSRRSQPGEPQSFAWADGTAGAKSGAILAVSVSHLHHVEVTTSGATSHQVRPIVAPSVSAAHGSPLIVGAYSMAAEGPISPASSMNLLGGVQSGVSLAVASETLAASGDSQDRTATRKTAGSAVGQLISISGPLATAADASDEEDDDEVGDDEHHLPDEEQDEVTAPGTRERWEDPATWPSGTVPSSTDDVTIEGHITIESAVQARTVTVSPNSTLEFSPTQDAALDVSGNVVVEGTLRMGPNDPANIHLLRFVGVDEAAYVGGGHDVLGSDVGLWFTGHGQAQFEGVDRLPWTRAAGSLQRGSTAITLEDVPVGWRLGDELYITPTGPPGTAGHHTGYSHGRITSIMDRTITLDTPLAFDHPRVAGQWTAEVMNLTRNVRIEGTPSGRAHIQFNHTLLPQSLRNVSLRHLGPRQESDNGFTEGVLGRYPVHFHHNANGSNGSLLENVVVRDSGNRAFVAHASNGVTFRGTIAHDVFETPYWWDLRDTSNGIRNAIYEPPSHDITYDRAVASLVRSDPAFRGYRLSGFSLGHGNNTSITGSVAVGVQGNVNASGFDWPEGATGHPDAGIHAHWIFRDNVGHNNRVNGIFTWQNTDDPQHIIEHSVMYHNGQDGIEHGAYINHYTYRDMVLFGNGRSGLQLHSQGPQVFTGIEFDGAGISAYGVATTRHNQIASGATLRAPEIRGYRRAAVGFLSSDVEHLDIIDPNFAGGESTWFYLADTVPPESVIRVQMADGSAFQLHPASSHRGVPVPEWNARREIIQPFD